MKTVLPKEAGRDMPLIFYHNGDFKKGGLNRKDWPELANQNHPRHQQRWEELLREFEYHGVDGCYFLYLDKGGNLCLATENEIEEELQFI